MYKRVVVSSLIAVLAVGAAAWLIWEKVTVQNELNEAQTVPGEVFSFEALTQKARLLSQAGYVKPADNLPEALKNLSYDQHRDIRFVRENGPWYKQKLPFEVQFFHLGSIFQMSVPINEIVDGKVRPIRYAPLFFDYGKNNLKTDDFRSIGYAGFRLHAPLNTVAYYDELVSFLGASYFRALGRHEKYGLSARGLAIDTAVQTGEEFPVFKEFWIEKPKRRTQRVNVYALLDSPSVAGAYHFRIKPGDFTTMEVEAVLFPRKAINKLGVAPLTSMFLFGENNKYRFDDHRPEVHDSDGLLVWNGQGEWLWRPLDNSKYLRISSFVDNHPKGFGLMQRDQNPEHYMDFEAMYEQRPSVWVEPMGDWGKGVVQLVEIPSLQEIHDNIVAYWIPKQPIEAGKEYRFKYKLYWGGDVPMPRDVAQVNATYTGIGGVSGMLESNKRKFVIDFTGKGLREAFEKGEISPEVSVSEGTVTGVHMMYNPLSKGVIVYVDFKPNGKTSEIRISLKKNGQNVSEVWSYQWLP